MEGVREEREGGRQVRQRAVDSAHCGSAPHGVAGHGTARHCMAHPRTTRQHASEIQVDTAAEACSSAAWGGMSALGVCTVYIEGSTWDLHRNRM